MECSRKLGVAARPGRRRSTFGLVAATLLVRLAFVSPAQAEDIGDFEAILDESVVATASKSAVTANRAPATSTNITADDLRRYGIRSLDEAINYLSLGMVTQNPLHAVEIGARGVLLTSDYGNHVLLLINGHAANEQWDGTAYFERGAGIPFELIDHIEVILGAGSVLYGSNAMLGVINVITKRAKDYDGFHLMAEGDIGTTFRGAIGFGKEFTLFGKPAEVTVQAEYYTQTGPTFRFGPQSGLTNLAGWPTNYGPNDAHGTWGGQATKAYWARIPDAFASISWNDFQLDLRAEAYQRATPYINQSTLPFGDFNNPNAYELDRWLTFDLKHRLALGATTTLRSRLYGDDYSYEQRNHMSNADACASGQAHGCSYKNTGRSTWLGLEEQLAIDWTHNGKWASLVGVDGRIRDIGADQEFYDSVTNTSSSVGNYAKDGRAIGVYAQQMAEPTSWLSLNAGARLDADDRFDARISPRAAANAEVWRGGTMKLIYSTAFRSPTYYEQQFTDRYTQLASAQLKPESVKSVEASFEQRVGSQRFLVGVFQSWWSNMVLLQGVSLGAIDSAIASGLLQPGSPTVTQYQNASSIDNWGFNVVMEGAALRRAMRYAVNFTGAYARRNGPDGPVPLPVAPQLFGNARVSYALPGELPVLALVAQVQGPRPADHAFGNGFSPLPYAPTQLQVRATISGPIPRTGLSYRVSADVATASRNPYVVGPYQSASGGVSAAELVPVQQRTFTVGLQYDWR